MLILHRLSIDDYPTPPDELTSLRSVSSVKCTILCNGIGGSSNNFCHNTKWHKQENSQQIAVLMWSHCLMQWKPIFDVNQQVISESPLNFEPPCHGIQNLKSNEVVGVHWLHIIAAGLDCKISNIWCIRDLLIIRLNGITALVIV